MELSEPQQTASEIVARIRAGGAGAEAELYARYRRGMSMILSQRVSSPEDAEDLVQESFRLAIEKIRRGELRDPAKLPQFLNSLARNLAIHHFRRHGRRRDDEGIEAAAGALAVGPGQIDRLRRRERGVLALRVLRELETDRDRDLLFRFYIAEDDKAEICRDLGLSSLHFNRVLHRAKQRYRKLYEKIADGT